MQNEFVAEDCIFCQFIVSIEKIKLNKTKKCELGKQKRYCRPILGDLSIDSFSITAVQKRNCL